MAPIVMGDGGYAAQEILDGADRQSLIARDGDGGEKRRVRPPQCIDLGDPLARMSVMVGRLDRRQAVELQVIMRIDKSRQEAIAAQVHDQIAWPRVGMQFGDP
jgi:hypothetical protein